MSHTCLILVSYSSHTCLILVSYLSHTCPFPPTHPVFPTRHTATRHTATHTPTRDTPTRHTPTRHTPTRLTPTCRPWYLPSAVPLFFHISSLHDPRFFIWIFRAHAGGAPTRALC